MKVERIEVSRKTLEEMRATITEVVPNYNPMTGEADGHTFTVNGVNGYIVQDNNIVLHKADGTLKCWFTKENVNE